jgi:hypothetical protein
MADQNSLSDGYLNPQSVLMGTDPFRRRGVQLFLAEHGGALTNGVRVLSSALSTSTARGA